MKSFRLPRFAAALLGLLAGAPAVADEIHIPLVQGLVVVRAAHDKGADYEFISSVTAVTADAVEFTLQVKSADASAQDVNGDSFVRRIRKADLQSAHRIIGAMMSGDPDTFPGSTQSQLSTEMLNELKTKGETAVVVGSMHSGSGKCAETGSSDELSSLFSSGRRYFRGSMTRVGADAPYAVLLNGRPVKLPALTVHTHVTLGGESIDGDTLVLDDPANAMALGAPASSDSACSSGVVRIDYPDDAAAKDLATALSGGSCRAELHGIYFGTDSDRLLPQSVPGLQQIAALLKSNPGWTVGVEGHTDNTGSAEHNLDLSKRRAQAVRDALVNSYGIAADRLTVAGFGQTKPVDSNDTLAGRAHNRRVELSRKCS